MLVAMASEIREIRDEDAGVVAEILESAYGPGVGRSERLQRYRSLGPETWLLALEGGAPAGVAGAIDFGAYAYVGLVGVHPSMQRRGVALGLMRRLLDILDARGRQTILLDASEAGAPLYRMLGFVEDDSVELFVKAAHEPVPSGADARPMSAADLPAVAALDRRVVGADRAPLLEFYYDEGPERAFVVDDGDGGVVGYAFAQRYAVGPWAAGDSAAARAALSGALSCTFPAGATIAVPAANGIAGVLLEPYGFARTRVLAHMRLGPPVDRRRDMVYGQASLAAG
jgi:predicted N-acetyltransferase YhbS